MKLIIFITIFTALVSSCANVNTASREHYYQGQKMRHGVIPVAPRDDEAKVKRAVSEESIKRGEEVYSRNCLECHGADGKGISNINLSKISKDIPNFKFYLLVSRYKQAMPGWKNILTEKELKDLESYLYSLANI